MYITKHTINLCKTSDDGRMTRMKLKEFYYKKIPNRIYIPKERMWYTCSLFSDTCKHKVNNNINL